MSAYPEIALDDLRVWQQRSDAVWAAKLGPKRKLVLLAFLWCDRHGDGLELGPALDHTIASTIGCADLSEADVKTAIEAFRESGILGVVGRVAHFRPERLPRRSSPRRVR